MSSIIILYAALFVIMYLFFILPRTKQQKAQNLFIANLKKGDQVATASGIIGRVTKIDDDVVDLLVDGKNTIKVLKSAVSKESTDSLKGKNYFD